MKHIITYDNLRDFAYSNDIHVKGDIKGIVVDFIGLGNQIMVGETNPPGSEAEDRYGRGMRLAKHGIIYLLPYNNPWNWMNAQAVEYTEEIIAAVSEKYSLAADVPTVACGGSMGGMSALVYTRYAKNTPVACAANCPVCDLPFHYTERPDLPRTLYSALWYEDAADIESALRARSPIHLAETMPDVKYTIFHCTADEAVNIHSHSERFVELMQRLGRDVTFIKVPDKGHCDLTQEAADQYEKAMIDALG